GAGKSTAALHLVEAGYRFLSNDRVLAKPLDDRVEALGYPKQPRVNPGTLLSHPRLRHRLPPAERRILEAMTPADLWDLERKSDVDLNAIYVNGTIELRGDLKALVLLRWTREGVGLDVRRLPLARALAAVPVVHKDLGVFDIDRPLDTPAPPPDLAAYARLFARIAVVEVRGRVQPAALADIIGPLVGRCRSPARCVSASSRARGWIGDHETAPVRAQHRGRHLRRDRAVEHVLERRALGLAADEHDDLVRRHDRRETERHRALAHLAL